MPLDGVHSSGFPTLTVHHKIKVEVFCDIEGVDLNQHFLVCPKEQVL